MTIGASLGARMERTIEIRNGNRKRIVKRDKCISCMVTASRAQEVERLAAKLNMNKSRLLEQALVEMCQKHGITSEDKADG